MLMKVLTKVEIQGCVYLVWSKYKNKHNDMQSMHSCINTDSCYDPHLHKKVYFCYSTDNTGIKLGHVHRHRKITHMFLHLLHHP